MTLSTQAKAAENNHYFAALDIGSNSFHFVLARQIHQHIQIVHSEKYKVKLASGLDNNNYLSNEAIMRGIATLASLSSSTSHLNTTNFRAVATYTLRTAKNANEFLSIAKQVFPFDIEVISGHEEARLIYRGVNYHSASTKQRLVLDIGGGSTECIIGLQADVLALASLTLGCVSYSKAFFADNKMTKRQFNNAITAAKVEISPMVKRYKKLTWQEVIGTSGTIKAIYQIVNYHRHINQPIHLTHLHEIKDKLIACRNIEKIDIAGLKPGRNHVIAAGVAILIALMEALEISKIDYCKYALREGVLFEQQQNSTHNDTRQRTINSLTHRFNIDLTQVDLVKSYAEHIFAQVHTSWKFSQPIYYELLIAAAHVHEIGYDINSTRYHKHGEYILAHADLAGFNQEQQQALAWLIGNQRKTIATSSNALWHQLQPNLLVKSLTILRLSIILSQQRFSSNQHFPAITITQQKLLISFDRQWLAQRPQIASTLVNEQQHLAKHGINIEMHFH